MEPNRRDTPLRRCTTYIWGAALMLALGIIGIVLYPFFNRDLPDLVDQEQEHSKLVISLQEVHQAQAEIYESYKYDEEAAAKALWEKIKK